MLREQIDEKGLTFETHNHSGSLHLCGDEVRLRQALINYVGNAVKFTDSGTVSLKISTLEEKTHGYFYALRLKTKASG